MTRRAFFGMLAVVGRLFRRPAKMEDWTVEIETGPSYCAVSQAKAEELWFCYREDGHHFYWKR